MVPEGESFVIHPGEFCLGRTLEWVELPDDIVARIEGKSSLGRLGLIVHATAGFCDPGWKGTLTLELNNLTRVPIKLYPGLADRAAVVHDARPAGAAPVREPRARQPLPGPARRDRQPLPGGARRRRPGRVRLCACRPLAVRSRPRRSRGYIAGGLLALYAVVLAYVGLTGPTFPYNSRGERAVVMRSAPCSLRSRSRWRSSRADRAADRSRLSAPIAVRLIARRGYYSLDGTRVARGAGWPAKLTPDDRRAHVAAASDRRRYDDRDPATSGRRCSDVWRHARPSPTTGPASSTRSRSRTGRSARPSCARSRSTTTTSA